MLVERYGLILNAETKEQAILVTYADLLLSHIRTIYAATKEVEALVMSPESATENRDKVWDNLVVALTSVASISRIFTLPSDTKTDDRKMRDHRVRLLRFALSLDENKGYFRQIRKARNMCEHLDEYLDPKLYSAIGWDSPAQLRQVPKFEDRECITNAEFKKLNKEVIRWFEPYEKIINVFDESIALSELSKLCAFLSLSIRTGIFNRGRYHFQHRINWIHEFE